MTDVPALWTYYERRADEYEAGTLEGLEEHAEEIRAESQTVARILSRLTFGTLLDVGAGTGIFTRQLRGRRIALDQSAAMLRHLRRNIESVSTVRADARHLPLRDDAVDCVFAAHLYGHLDRKDGEVFLGEARRVGRQLLILDSGRRSDQPAEAWEERRLADGSLFTIFKRFFTGDDLANEVPGRVLHDGNFFVVVASQTVA